MASAKNVMYNMTTTGQIGAAGQIVLEGMFVAATSTFKLWNGTSAADLGQPIMTNFIAPIAPGYYRLGNIVCTPGVYFDNGGNANTDVTFFVLSAD